jgi:uncharacterized membrane protein YjjP (DUF1212 family)
MHPEHEELEAEEWKKVKDKLSSSFRLWCCFICILVFMVLFVFYWAIGWFTAFVTGILLVKVASTGYYLGKSWSTAERVDELRARRGAPRV